jgi:hypothetical protein
MKSVLLLAAVYSLIIHQWHKEKGTALAKMNQNQKYLVEKKENEQQNAVRFTAAAQFLNIYSKLSKD